MQIVTIVCRSIRKFQRSYFSDIDECEISGSCEHLCNNTDGSYNCDCHYGYRLDVDRVRCNEGQQTLYTGSWTLC